MHFHTGLKRQGKTAASLITLLRPERLSPPETGETVSAALQQ